MLTDQANPNLVSEEDIQQMVEDTIALKAEIIEARRDAWVEEIIDILGVDLTGAHRLFNLLVRD